MIVPVGGFCGDCGNIIDLFSTYAQLADGQMF